MRLVTANVVGEFGVMAVFASDLSPVDIQDYCVFTAVADTDGCFSQDAMKFENMLGNHTKYSIEITQTLEVLNNSGDKVDNQYSFELEIKKLAAFIKEIE